MKHLITIFISVTMLFVADMAYARKNKDTKKVTSVEQIEKGKASRVKQKDPFKGLSKKELQQKIYNLSDSLKDANSLIKHLKSCLQEKDRSIEGLRDKSKADSILNCEDSTIFISDILNDINENDIHKRSREYYRLLKMIHDLNDLLQFNDINELTRNFIDARELLGQITDVRLNHPYVFDSMSNEQKQFFEHKRQTFIRWNKSLRW